MSRNQLDLQRCQRAKPGKLFFLTAVQFDERNRDFRISIEWNALADLVFQAVLDWTATYKTSGTTMTVIKIGIWNVTMNTTFDGKVTAIVEPKDLR